MPRVHQEITHLYEKIKTWKTIDDHQFNVGHLGLRVNQCSYTIITGTNGFFTPLNISVDTNIQFLSVLEAELHAKM